MREATCHASRREAIARGHLRERRVLFPKVLKLLPRKLVLLPVPLRPCELIQAVWVANLQGLKRVSVEIVNSAVFSPRPSAIVATTVNAKVPSSKPKLWRVKPGPTVRGAERRNRDHENTSGRQAGVSCPMVPAFLACVQRHSSSACGRAPKSARAAKTRRTFEKGIGGRCRRILKRGRSRRSVTQIGRK